MGDTNATQSGLSAAEVPGLSCAHTSLQFFRQLQRDGYSGDGLLLIDKALILASKLFACRFQYTGVPFMVHVIGAASILSALRASPHLVAAALIHNAYGNGDFGNARAGATDWKRGEIRRVLGWQVEHYVYEFSVFLRLGRGTFANLPSSIDGLSMTERGVLLLRLADLTEHYRDLGQVYGGRQRTACEMIEKFGAIWIHLAGELAGPTFASQLNRLFEETKAAELPLALCGLTGEKGSFSLLPQHYRRRTSVVLRQKMGRIMDAVNRRIVRFRCLRLTQP